MARASNGPAYHERFRAAAAYAGFGGSPVSGPISRFREDPALLLHGLYQQATIGPCTAPKPKARSPGEQRKWESWNRLGDMTSTEAMRLFIKILEEEDPAWYSRISDFAAGPRDDINPKQRNEIALEETRTIPTEKVAFIETQDKDIILEGLRCVSIYDKWEKLSVSGQQPRSRYEHGAVVLHDKMYIIGGNYNGRYLNDTQVLDLKTLTWSKVNATMAHDSKANTVVSPCAGHSLIIWGNSILSVAGHTKAPLETVTVKKFDTQTCMWSVIETNGEAPVSRGGQSVTLVGSILVIFGGEDVTRSLLNDVHVLNLQTMTWSELDAVGIPPSPRSYHSAAVHAERYLLIFGGRSHASCFNDLHILDLQNMEWSRPEQQGIVPAPRAGHAGVTIGDNWFIVGGGDNQNGIAETLLLNMSKLLWSVVTTIQDNAPIASEGLSLVTSSCSGEDMLVAFGGYNGKYNNEVFVLKPSYTADAKPKLEIHASTTTGMQAKDVEADTDIPQDGKIREIVMDDSVLDYVKNARKEQLNIEIIETLRAEKEELLSALTTEQIQTVQLKQELVEAETRNADLMKELQSVRGQLATEQSRCFKLEVDMAEIRQKLLTLEVLQKEVELLRRQKAASEQAAIEAKERRSSGSVWGWLAGTPPEYKSDN